MILHNPTIRFYLQEGELRPAVVIVPEKPKAKEELEEFSESFQKALFAWEQSCNYAFAHPILFKEAKDELKIKEYLFDIHPEPLDSVDDFKPCTDKSYQIEGEIEIKTMREDHGGMTAWKTKKFAFLIPKEKDVLDTGARLPEQKEESQEVSRLELKNAIHQVYISGEWDKSLVMSFADALAPILQSKFIIHRKP